MRNIVLVAAESFELTFVPESTAEAKFSKVTGGAGPRLAARAIAAYSGSADIIVSAGLCGGLDPSLHIGDVFAATTVNGQPCLLPASTASHATGPLLSVDRIVGSISERAELCSQGYAAVEMEAAGVASEAKRRNVPFYCIRAVSDTASEEFSVDLNAARDRDGRIRVGRILAQAARRPGTIVPELLRLRRNSQVAARTLGAFLATCNF